MTNLLPGQVIHLPDADYRVLGQHLERQISALETRYSDYFRRIAMWWRWYEAEPRMKTKNFPFAGASNVVIPLIQIMSDGLTARALASVFGSGEQVWVARTENDDNAAMARDMIRYMNWQASGNDYDLRAAIYDCFSEMYPIGESVLSLDWRNDLRTLYAPGGKGKGFSRSVAQTVTFGRGPIVEHSPREHYLWDTAFEIGDAPVVVKECPHTWSSLKNLARLQPKGWRNDIIEKIRHDGGQDSPSQEVAKEKKRADDINDTSLDSLTEPHDIRVVHVDWPVMEDAGFTKPGAELMSTPDIPIVAVFHRKTSNILRLYAEPYNLPQKPFFGFHYKKRSGRGSSVGVSKRLVGMQSLMTTQFNQSVDKDTRANAVWAITSSRKHMDTPLDPSHPIYAPGMDKEFKVLALHDNPGPQLSLIQAAQVIAERQVGIFDPALGRESRQGGHPSPATSTLALLENTDVMAGPTMTMVRRQLAKLGESIAILNQQFETNEDGKIHRVLGGMDGDRVTEFIFPREPIPGNYQFDVRALSPQNNPDSEMNRAVQVGQMNQLYWGQVIQGVQILESQQVGPNVKMAWVKYIDSMTHTYMRFLESANVDEIEKYVLQLRQAQQQAPGDLRNAALAGGGGLPGTTPGTLQQLPVGLPPRPITSGTPLSLGATG